MAEIAWRTATRRLRSRVFRSCNPPLFPVHRPPDQAVFVLTSAIGSVREACVGANRALYRELRACLAVKPSENGQEHIMPILLWLLGVPLSLVIILALTGVI